MKREEIAREIADAVWPIEGDPTFPQTREESHGWQTAYQSALDGIDCDRALSEDEYEGSTVGHHAFIAGHNRRWECGD